jgi:hypothetical protein
VEYWLYWCNSLTPLPTQPPATRVKVWRITNTRSSSEIRLTLHCNGVEVLNTLISGTTCDHSYWNYWTRDVEKIEFASNDDASDHYRPGE